MDLDADLDVPMHDDEDDVIASTEPHGPLLHITTDDHSTPVRDESEPENDKTRLKSPNRVSLPSEPRNAITTSRAPRRR